MKIKTQELKNTALDWAVAKCNEQEVQFNEHNRWYDTSDPQFADPDDPCIYSPPTFWEQGGPIIEREYISIESTTMCGEEGSFAWRGTRIEREGINIEEYGPTPLIAAMRCFVASKLGDEVDVPDMLVHVKWDGWGRS